MKRLDRTRKTIWLILGLIVLIQAGYLVFLIRSFQRDFQEAIWDNARTAGENVKGNLDFILGLGVDLDHLVKLEPLLRGVLNDAPFLEALAIRDSRGRTLYYCDRDYYFEGPALQSRHAAIKDFPAKTTQAFDLLDRQGRTPGALLVGIDARRLERTVNEIRLDVGTVVVISLLVIFDFIFFSVAYNMTIPLKKAADEIRLVDGEGLLDLPISRTGVDFLDASLDEFDDFRNGFKGYYSQLRVKIVGFKDALVRQGLSRELVEEISEETEDVLDEFRIVGDGPKPLTRNKFPELIRPAVFLFVFAEALTISFLPLYAEELYRPLWNLPKNVVLGLPIAVFMFFLGISLPLGGAWSDRVGRKKVFFCGAVITSFGLVLSGAAADVVWLIVFRSLAAMGFGLCFMTCQGYIVDATSDSDRAQGMALFIAAFYGGTLCGSAIGGMLAERLGFRVLFYCGGAVSLASAWFMNKFVVETVEAKKSVVKKLGYKGWFRLLTDRNFMALVLFQSIPSKICLIGLVYYVVPLFLRGLGNSQSDIGRVVMGYSLVMIIFSPMVSRFADRRKRISPFIFWGGVFSGLSLAPLFFWSSTVWVALAIVFLGLSHSLSVSCQAKITTQLRVVREVGVGGGFGVFRLLERVGNVAAPIILGILTSSLGYAESLAVIGIYVVVSSLLFGLIFREAKSQA
ncbi:MAG: MFS transporter [Pseudomonadota bacterium]